MQMGASDFVIVMKASLNPVLAAGLLLACLMTFRYSAEDSSYILIDLYAMHSLIGYF